MNGWREGGEKEKKDRTTPIMDSNEMSTNPANKNN